MLPNVYIPISLKIFCGYSGNKQGNKYAFCIFDTTEEWWMFFFEMDFFLKMSSLDNLKLVQKK